MAGPPRAAIVVTGDEVLRGRVTDRNGTRLAAWCDARGLAVDRVTIVGDELDAIADAVATQLAGGTDLVITTGGLGGTHDDVTMAAVARAAGLPLTEDARALDLVRAGSARGPRHRSVPAAVRDAIERKQAALPRGAQLLEPIGTAPGCIVQAGPQLVVVLPGPPYEAERMWEAAVATPALVGLMSRAGAPPRLVLRMYGVVESQIVAALGQIPGPVRTGARLGVCAKAGEIELTIADRADGGAHALGDALEGAFPGATFTRTGEQVEEVVGAQLTRAKQRLGVAESCTAGLLGARVANVPGASSWFLGGVIAYDNALKRDLLGVPDEILATDGAVSPACAQAMAEGVRTATGSQWGLSITGIAGPGGGTPGKPVGTVLIGCAGPAGSRVEQHRFPGDRTLIRERATVFALHLLRRSLAAAR